VLFSEADQPGKAKRKENKDDWINPPLQDTGRLGRRLLQKQKQASVEKDD
jgi:hypothetical protein